MHDVIVIGGGPSGLNTARLLSEEGLSVLVLEKKSEAGQNIICTGILGNEAFDEFDLSRDSIVDEIRDVRLVSPVETTLVYRHSKSFARVVNRERFDKGLARRVLDSGAEIRFEHQVVDLEVEDSRVRVVCRNGSNENIIYYGRLAVVATGVNHALNRKLGLGRAKGFLNAAQIEIEVENPDLTTIYFGNNVAPGVFAWTVPSGAGRMRVGLLTDKDPKPYLQALLARVIHQEKAALNGSRIQYKSIAQGAVGRTTDNRVMAVGEAGGQVKTTTGGGIYFGLLCSRIAAEVIIKNWPSGALDAKALSEYEKLWKKAILREIQIGYYVRKLCARLSDNHIEKLFLIAKNNGIFPYIRENGEFDWHGDLIISLVRKTPIFRGLL